MTHYTLRRHWGRTRNKTKIEAVTVTHETAKCIWINGIRRNKRRYQEFFTTWKEARDQLVTNINDGIAEREKELVEMRAELKAAQRMKPPKEDA